MRRRQTTAVDVVPWAIVGDILRELNRTIAGFARFGCRLGCAMGGESSNSSLDESNGRDWWCDLRFCELRGRSGAE
jgi:hypothetical protein